MKRGSPMVALRSEPIEQVDMHVDQPIRNRVVVVTGAGGGFGQLISQKCAALGARVVCADINEEGLDETITSIREAGGQGISHRTDVASYVDMQALAAKAS